MSHFYWEIEILFKAIYDQCSTRVPTSASGSQEIAVKKYGGGKGESKKSVINKNAGDALILKGKASR